MSKLPLLIAVVAVAFGIVDTVGAAEPIEIGSRLELFIDDFLIGDMTGDAQQYLHKPEPQEVVLVTDEPWEGNTSAYFTVFRDGDLYRMYYRGSHFDVATRKAAHPEKTCYAESRDGVRWVKPSLGLVEFDGSTDNNIVWDGTGTHNFTPFKDPNPTCAPDAKYKALAGASRGYKKGLYAVKSPDAIHWKLMSEEPVITKGAFDSQNLAFWDPRRACYADFHRTFTRGVRAIMTCTSPDFLHWTEPVLLEHPGAPNEHLYTNAVMAYPRAPHILIGFPTRFLPKTQQVEPTLMSSRDGRTFPRWTEPLIPITAPEDRDGNRSNYMAWGLVQLPGNDREYSLYATEAYYTGPDSRLRRLTYRVDGFVSVRAGADGGAMVTKPIVFSGNKLVVNFAARGEGRVTVELQDAQGKPIPKFTLADAVPLAGDEIAGSVAWKSGDDVGSLAGKPVRLHFALKGADLFSIRFAE